MKPPFRGTSRFTLQGALVNLRLLPFLHGRTNHTVRPSIIDVATTNIYGRTTQGSTTTDLIVLHPPPSLQHIQEHTAAVVTYGDYLAWPHGFSGSIVSATPGSGVVTGVGVA